MVKSSHRHAYAVPENPIKTRKITKYFIPYENQFQPNKLQNLARNNCHRNRI